MIDRPDCHVIGQTENGDLPKVGQQSVRAAGERSGFTTAGLVAARERKPAQPDGLPIERMAALRCSLGSTMARKLYHWQLIMIRRLDKTHVIPDKTIMGDPADVEGQQVGLQARLSGFGIIRCRSSVSRRPNRGCEAAKPWMGPPSGVRPRATWSA